MICDLTHVLEASLGLIFNFQKYSMEMGILQDTYTNPVRAIL